jgi:hypothetical protein
MPVTTFACPKCDTTLKLSVALAAGQKIKCPRCATTFAPPARTDPEPARAVKQKSSAPAPRRGPRDDEEEARPTRTKPARRRDDEDFPPERGEARIRRRDSEEAAPRTRPAAGRASLEEADDLEDGPRPKKDKKSIKKRGGGRVVLFGILGGVLLLLLAGGGTAAYFLWFYGINRGSGDEDPLAYLPADTNIVVGMDLAALLKDPTIGPQIRQSMLQQNVGNDFPERIKKETGLEVEEVFSQMVIGMKFDTSKAALQGGPPGMGPQDKPQKMTMVLRTSKPFDQKKMAKSGKDAVRKSYKGKTYYEVNENELKTLFMPSDRTIVMTVLRGAEAEALIGSDGKPALSAEGVTLIRGVEKNTGWMAFVPPEAERNTLLAELKKQPIPPDGKAFADALTKARGVAIYGQLGDQVKFGCNLAFGDDATAADTMKLVSGVWEKEKGGLTNSPMLLFMPKVKKLADEVVKSVKFSAVGPVLMVSAEVNRTSATEVFNDFQKGMGGGMGGPPGGVIQPPQPGGRQGVPGGMPPGGPGGRPPRGGAGGKNKGGA